MRLEWLEDLLAVIETGSFSVAAHRRILTQSAFSRRMQMLEVYLGAEIFDRSRKPIRANEATLAQTERIRTLVHDLRMLAHDLKQHERSLHRRIGIACQHSIMTTAGPRLVKDLLARQDLTVRLHSANFDECLGLLLTNQTELVLVHLVSTIPLPARPDFFEILPLKQDHFVPVASAAVAQLIGTGSVPHIAYPGDIFLGRLFDREISARVDPAITLMAQVETALTLAALQMAEEGLGVVWAPLSLCRTEIAQGRLVNLSDRLPQCPMELMAIRLSGPKTAFEDEVWSILPEIRL